jgi:hypothetical protein
MCFFAGGDSLVIPAGVQKFIESNKSTLKTRMDDVAAVECHAALEHFNEHRNTSKMTTGAANLDSLIESIEEGQCYLFYGNKGILDGLAHRLLVNCVLSVREKHGFESMATARHELMDRVQILANNF